MGCAGQEQSLERLSMRQAVEIHGSPVSRYVCISTEVKLVFIS